MVRGFLKANGIEPKARGACETDGSAEALLTPGREMSIIETPGGTMEAVGTTLLYLEKGFTVNYLDVKPGDTIEQTHIRNPLVRSDMIVVGPHSPEVEHFRSCEGQHGIGKFFHFDTKAGYGADNGSGK